MQQFKTEKEIAESKAQQAEKELQEKDVKLQEKDEIIQAEKLEKQQVEKEKQQLENKTQQLEKEKQIEKMNDYVFTVKVSGELNPNITRQQIIKSVAEKAKISYEDLEKAVIKSETPTVRRGIKH
jgi:uncharacterized ubiquitin-like protein YukD